MTPALQAIEARTRTNNKFKPHVTPGPGNGTQAPRWETSALTTVSLLFLHIIAYAYNLYNKTKDKLANKNKVEFKMNERNKPPGSST